MVERLYGRLNDLLAGLFFAIFREPSTRAVGDQYHSRPIAFGSGRGPQAGRHCSGRNPPGVYFPISVHGAAQGTGTLKILPVANSVTNKSPVFGSWAIAVGVVSPPAT
jgi:hypothetical protein